MRPDVCGCCEIPAGTPIPVLNRPGLDAIVYRAGTYATFRAAMLQRLARQSTLASLKTRDDDDYAITLIDMWATVGDVLTFYQERIANEAFLRTGRMRDSVLRLARLIDYRLRPGVAASTRLAFTLDRDTVLEIPVGLRAQSVPAGKEQPQIYETLESIVADARLNRLRVLPAPEAYNPLARGSTEGILAPGADGLAIARMIGPNARLVLFDAAGAIELLAARELRIDEERATLAWSGPVQGTSWDIRSEAYVFDRTFRIFGCDAPAQYVEPVTVSGKVDWQMRTFSSFAYTPPATDVLELDGKYEDLAVGTRLLISIPGSSNTLADVLEVSQAQATFKPSAATTSPVSDTVTRVKLSSLPGISDRRKVLLYEIRSPRVRFWGYRYPEQLGGTRVLVPARRVDPATVDVGVVIENNALTAGTRLGLESIAAGRAVILREADPESPQLGEVAGVAAVGLDVGIAPTADDPTTAAELKLDAENGVSVIALRSTILPLSFTLTNATPSVSITVGAGPSRTVWLTSRPTAIGGAVNALQNGINAAVAMAPELADCRVTQAEGTLILAPGIAGASISVGPSPVDATTARELGLVDLGAIRVDALRSGDLTVFPVVSNTHPQLDASFGPLGPRLLQFPSAPSTLAIACSMLRTALRAADAAPAYQYAVVVNLEDSILVVPGTGGASVREYLRISLREPLAAPLATASSALLGNIARASHGESVRDEVLGDGDASLAFQSFELQKKPLTLISSSAPGGTESTLDVRVNGVRWSEVPSLFARAPDALVYTTQVADDGTVTVGFGDGRSGARLPSGRRNVVAGYRKGSGLAGRVGRGTLRTPLDLPTGLKSVINPLPATGGADPEALEQARENAPTTVRTFGRAVSLRDFEDLVRSSGEVAKAHATWVWNGETRAVHLTVAAQGGASFAPEDLARIHASVNAARDPNHALFMDNHATVPIVVRATISVRPDHSAKRVSEAARAALLDALSFDVLGFGQPLALSEVIAILQDVDGVLAVDVDVFHFKDQSAAFLAERGATAEPVQRSLRIFSARPDPLAIPPVLPAEMASIETPADDLQLLTSGGLPEGTP